jgi:hypothetical protein
MFFYSTASSANAPTNGAAPLRIFPNPAQTGDRLTLSAPFAQAELYNLQGGLVEIFQPGAEIRLPQAAGAYLLKVVTTEQQTHTQMILVR